MKIFRCPLSKSSARSRHDVLTIQERLRAERTNLPEPRQFAREQVQSWIIEDVRWSWRRTSRAGEQTTRHAVYALLIPFSRKRE